MGFFGDCVPPRADGSACQLAPGSVPSSIQRERAIEASSIEKAYTLLTAGRQLLERGNNFGECQSSKFMNTTTAATLTVIQHCESPSKPRLRLHLAPLLCIIQPGGPCIGDSGCRE